MTTERLTISIAGMTCASCVARVEKALRAREGVISADVDLGAQRASVAYAPCIIAPRQLVDIVEHLGYTAPRWTAVRAVGTVAPQPGRPDPRSHELSPVWPALAGLAASLLLVGFYLGLVSVLQDQAHATQLLWGDRWLVAAIALGFGLQMGLYVHLRQLKQRHHKLGQCSALAAAGTGTSSLAMVACCAHHLSDVLPFLGLSVAATFLNQYRSPFMLAGLGANLAGIAVMLRLIRRVRAGVRMAQEAQAAPCHGEGSEAEQPERNAGDGVRRTSNPGWEPYGQNHGTTETLSARRPAG